MRLLAALQFLTVIPLPKRRKFSSEELGRAIAYFPLVGVLIGLVLAGLNWVLSWLLPVAVVKTLLLVGLVLISGALHLDGFIDTFDGITGSKPREKRLEIMTDSHAGAIGVVTVILLILAKYSALSTITTPLSVLLLMPVLSRWIAVCAIYSFPYARQTGMGLMFKQGARWYHLAMATVISLAVAVPLLSWWGAVLIGGCVRTRSAS